jgi:hypothetical protein
VAGGLKHLESVSFFFYLPLTNGEDFRAQNQFLLLLFERCFLRRHVLGQEKARPLLHLPVQGRMTFCRLLKLFSIAAQDLTPEKTLVDCIRSDSSVFRKLVLPQEDKTHPFLISATHKKHELSGKAAFTEK